MIKKPLVLNNGVVGQLKDADGIGITSSIVVGSQTEDPSAVATFESTSKGILVPRMTASQRDAIASPATSLMIFNTTDNAFNYYDGATWQALDDGDLVDGGTY